MKKSKELNITKEEASLLRSIAVLSPGMNITPVIFSFNINFDVTYFQSTYNVVLLWKDSLNSVDQQFHQYQQRQQPPLTLTHWT